MKEKIKACPVCGKEMATSAKVCPSCGAKNKKPIYKKWWFWALIVLLIAAVGSSAGGGSDPAPQKSQGETQPSASSVGNVSEPTEPEAPAITYTACTVKQLMDDLNSNALKAEKTYQDQFVELTGKVNVIDSDGSYISLRPADNEYAIIGVTCYLRNDEQVAAVLELSVGDTVTVRGQITNVGEVMGYSLDIDSFI